MRVLCGVMVIGGLLVPGALTGQVSPALPHDSTAVRPLQRRGDGDLETLKAAARLVVLDVVVTDAKGHPLTGLKAGDFSLLEDGTGQKVSSFVEHGPADPAVAAKMVAAQKLPPNVFTNAAPAGDGSASTVILLDALDTSVQAQMVLRQQVIEFMKTVKPGTQMAIFQLDMQLHMMQGMTADPDTLREAVNGKRDQVVMTPLLGGPYAPEFEKQRMRREILTRSMKGLARYLSAFPGRKNLIWFTGDIPIELTGADPRSPFADEMDSMEQFGKMTEVLTLNRIAVYPIDARGLRTDPRFSAENGGRDAMRGGQPFGVRDGMEHGYLDEVAEKTGGKAFYNTNGLAQVIGEVVDAGSHFYTLTYAPTNKQNDGMYRKLKVEMAREGLRLEYRRGYYAVPDMPQQPARMRLAKPVVTADGVVAAAETASEMRSRNTTEAAMTMGAAPSREILFYARVNPLGAVVKDKGGDATVKGNYLDQPTRKAGYRMYEILYSIDIRPMHFMPSVDGSYHGRVEYVAMVYDDRGQRVNGVVAKAPLDVDGLTYRESMRKGMTVVQRVAIPAKGRYFLRLGVHDVDGNLMGTVEIPVDTIQTRGSK